MTHPTHPSSTPITAEGAVSLLREALTEIVARHGIWTNGMYAANIASRALAATDPAAIQPAGEAKPVVRLHEYTSDRPYTEGKKFFEMIVLDRSQCRDGLELFAAPQDAKAEQVGTPNDEWEAYARSSGLLNESGIAPDPAKAQTAYFAYTAAWNRSFQYNSVAMEIAARQSVAAPDSARDAAVAMWNATGEQLQKADDVLRSLSSYVGQGLCADTENLDYEEMEARIKEGIDTIVKVEASRASVQGKASDAEDGKLREYVAKAKLIYEDGDEGMQALDYLLALVDFDAARAQQQGEKA